MHLTCKQQCVNWPVTLNIQLLATVSLAIFQDPKRTVFPDQELGTVFGNKAVCHWLTSLKHVHILSLAVLLSSVFL